eukprot:364839-Chlamydomonas_euryale.AAC.6
MATHRLGGSPGQALAGSLPQAAHQLRREFQSGRSTAGIVVPTSPQPALLLFCSSLAEGMPVAHPFPSLPSIPAVRSRRACVPALDLVAQVLCPDGVERAQATRCLDVADDTDDDHGRRLNDRHRLHGLLLVQLGAGLLHLAQNVGRACGEQRGPSSLVVRSQYCGRRPTPRSPAGRAAAPFPNIRCTNTPEDQTASDPQRHGQALAPQQHLARILLRQVACMFR